MVIEGMFSFGPEDNGGGGGKRRFGGIGGEINYVLGKIISILGGKCLHFGEKNISYGWKTCIWREGALSNGEGKKTGQH